MVRAAAPFIRPCLRSMRASLADSRGNGWTRVRTGISAARANRSFTSWRVLLATLRITFFVVEVTGEVKARDLGHVDTGEG